MVVAVYDSGEIFGYKKRGIRRGWVIWRMSKVTRWTSKSDEEVGYIVIVSVGTIYHRKALISNRGDEINDNPVIFRLHLPNFR